MLVMKFRPLPHEFGLRINLVPEFFSAGWVAGWEIGNAINMKLKVMRKGDIPVTSQVNVSFAFVNGKLVAVGGRAQVYAIRNRDEDMGNDTPSISEREPILTPNITEPYCIASGRFYRGERTEDTPYYEIGNILKEVDDQGRGNVQTNGMNFFSASDHVGEAPEERNDARFAELRFFNTLMRVREPDNRDELIRIYFLYVSGLLPEGEFLRKIENIEQRESRGNLLSQFV